MLVYVFSFSGFERRRGVPGEPGAVSVPGRSRGADREGRRRGGGERSRGPVPGGRAERGAAAVLRGRPSVPAAPTRGAGGAAPGDPGGEITANHRTQGDQHTTTNPYHIHVIGIHTFFTINFIILNPSYMFCFIG